MTTYLDNHQHKHEQLNYSSMEHANKIILLCDMMLKVNIIYHCSNPLFLTKVCSETKILHQTCFIFLQTLLPLAIKFYMRLLYTNPCRDAIVPSYVDAR